MGNVLLLFTCVSRYIPTVDTFIKVDCNSYLFGAYTHINLIFALLHLIHNLRMS